MLKQGQHIKTTVDAWLDFEEIIFYLIFFTHVQEFFKLQFMIFQPVRKNLYCLHW